MKNILSFESVKAIKTIIRDRYLERIKTLKDTPDIKIITAIREPEIMRSFPLLLKYTSMHKGSQELFMRQKKVKNRILEFSDNIIRNAFSGMKMENQKWASHQKEEIDWVLSKMERTPKRVIDIGCGHGRHCVELAKRGIHTFGIDIAEKNIEIAQKAEKDFPGLLRFECRDARKRIHTPKADAVLCLYDVVGSFPDEKDNLAVLNTARNLLLPGGKLFLSVMNIDFIKRKCRKYNHLVDDINEEFSRLVKLQGSNTMQSTGEVFDGQKIIIDMKDGRCYRKEQFIEDDALPVEYLICDRRYTVEGIARMVKKAGFVVEEIYCSNSGHFHQPGKLKDQNAKEIVIVAHKANPIKRYIQFTAPLGDCWK